MKVFAALLSAVVLLSVGQAGRAQVAKAGPLRVGAAKVDITPSEMPKRYLGVLDHPHSRAIVVDNGSATVALVTVDTILIRDPQWTRLSGRIASEVGIPSENLILSSTATHSYPGAEGRAGNDTLSPEEAKIFDDKVVDSVRQAKAKLQPARMSFGTGVSYINVNRDIIDPKTHNWWEGPNYSGNSDKTVAVLKFESMSGEPIAVYFNYAVFNVITGMLDLMSADVTGAAASYIEQATGGKAVAVLSLGAHGDQNPIYYQQTYDLRQMRIDDYAKRGQDISNGMPSGGEGLDRNDPKVALLMNEQKQMNLSMGQMLGEEVLHVMREPARAASNVEIYTARKTVTCPGRQRTNTGRGGVAGTYKDSDPVDIRLGMMMIGDVAIGSVNGWVYSAIGQRLKKESPYAKTMMSTIANGFSAAGYIPDDASYGHETFEVLGSRLKPGCAETAIVDGLIDMMPTIRY